MAIEQEDQEQEATLSDDQNFVVVVVVGTEPMDFTLSCISRTSYVLFKTRSSQLAKLFRLASNL